MKTPDGRLVEPARLPADLVEQLQAEADRRGVSIGRAAGDLIAEILPDALAEALRDAWALPTPDAKVPPNLTSAAPPELLSLSQASPVVPALASVPQDGPDEGSSDGIPS